MGQVRSSGAMAAEAGLYPDSLRCGCLSATVNEGQFRTNLLSAGYAIDDRTFADRSLFDEPLTFDHRFLPHAAATVGAVTGSAARLTRDFSQIMARDDTNSLRGLVIARRSRHRGQNPTLCCNRSPSRATGLGPQLGRQPVPAWKQS